MKPQRLSGYVQRQAALAAAIITGLFLVLVLIIKLEGCSPVPLD